MRKSRCPSQVGLARSCDDGGTGALRVSEGADDVETVHRVAFCGLYSKDHLTDGMRGKLKDVHSAFKRPAQDPSKIRLFDPTRATKNLGMCRTGASRPRLPPAEIPGMGGPGAPGAPDTNVEEEKYVFEPLVLWEPPAEDGDGDELQVDDSVEPVHEGEGEEGILVPSIVKKANAKRPPPIEVDGILARFLRPHQREGTQFLFDCTMGLREYDGAGCILADDMGLGKTLQSITILWTLMNQGFDGKPAVTHTIIACPVSLVTNWESELNKKWIGADRLNKKGIDVIAVSEATKNEVKGMIRRFTFGRAAILIISYETFRIHQKLFTKGNQCGLLICDEAHRLKNKETKTAVALSALPTKRRVLLSGTPIQNDLDEFYSMVHFCNPGLLGTEKDFHRNYQNPILRGREPDATDKDRMRGEEKSATLGCIVNQFILRRTNSLLSDHLPPKLVCVVCCSLSQLQLDLYRAFLSGKVAKQIDNGGKQTMVLAAITSLKKLCNHPALLFDGGKPSEGFEELMDMLPPSCLPVRGRGVPPILDYTLSGKFHVLHKMLKGIRATSDDKVVLVSNYTQTLDLFERMCQQESWPCCKLDGSCNIKKRTKMVEDFNDPRGKLFAFLLSSKAGGCGLNLIGGNRLVLFDPDWNPANDKQAAARVWRDGQKKKCVLYRMLCAGSIEEKVFERQLSKEGLSGIATNEEVEKAVMAKDELRDLFALHDDTPSHLHGKLMEEFEDEEEEDDDDDDDDVNAANNLKSSDGRKAGPPPPKKKGKQKELVFEKEQEGYPKETGDMHLWGHHLGCETVDDPILRDAGRRSAPEDGCVSFVFSLQVKGALKVEKTLTSRSGSKGKEKENTAEHRHPTPPKASTKPLGISAAGTGAPSVQANDPGRGLKAPGIRGGLNRVTGGGLSRSISRPPLGARLGSAVGGASSANAASRPKSESAPKATKKKRASSDDSESEEEESRESEESAEEDDDEDLEESVSDGDSGGAGGSDGPEDEDKEPSPPRVADQKAQLAPQGKPLGHGAASEQVDLVDSLPARSMGCMSATGSVASTAASGSASSSSLAARKGSKLSLKRKAAE